MASRKILAVLIFGICTSMVFAADLVGVSGSTTRFATPIDCQVGAAQVKLMLSGTALRKKLLFNVYSIGSYCEQGAQVRTAEELAAADCAKRLHLVMERDVAGKDMAEAFRSAVRQNYPAPLFTDEINTMVECIQSKDVQRGEHVWLTHVPKVGLHIQLGKSEVQIRNAKFSQAVWDIYLGKNNLGEAIKTGLVSRL